MAQEEGACLPAVGDRGAVVRGGGGGGGGGKPLQPRNACPTRTVEEVFFTTGYKASLRACFSLSALVRGGQERFFTFFFGRENIAVCCYIIFISFYFN